MSLLFWIFSGIIFLSGLFLNGYLISINLGHKEKTVNIIWSLNLAFTDFVFILLLPKRILLFPEIQLKLGSISTVFHMTSRSFFLAAMSISCRISMAFPAWLEKGQKASVITLAIWVLSLGLSIRNHDLLEVLLSEMDLYREWIVTNALVSHFVSCFLCLLTLIIACYTFCGTHQQTSSMENGKLPFSLVLTFLLCWLPYHTLFLLQILLITPNKDSSLPKTLVILAFFLIYSNCCLNAIICLRMNHSFFMNQDSENHPHCSPGQE